MLTQGKPALMHAAGWTAVIFLCLSAGPVLAQAAHPFGVPESGAGMGGPGWLSSFFGYVAAWQAHFYLQLTGAARAWQEQGGAWGLIGLSFAYGVFHALGPGHGKAVISSYVLANRQTARNGALLALLSALLQALVAIALVAVLAAVLGATAAAMNRATQWLETASYVLVTLLGAWLIWSKALRPLKYGRAAHAAHEGHRHHDAPEVHAHKHDHGHSHIAAAENASSSAHQHVHGAECGCGHLHAPPLAAVQGRLDLRRCISAILAVGLRPCSGALIVLVFALSQGFFLAGIASALAMGLGTGLTVAVLAGLAVLAGDLATRWGSRGSPLWAARLRYGVQALAACAVFLLGLVLLGGQLAAHA